MELQTPGNLALSQPEIDSRIALNGKIRELFAKVGQPDHPFCLQLDLLGAAFDFSALYAILTTPPTEEQESLLIRDEALVRLHILSEEKKLTIPPSNSFIHALSPAPVIFMQGETILIRGVNTDKILPPWVWWQPITDVRVAAAFLPLRKFLESDIYTMDVPITFGQHSSKPAANTIDQTNSTSDQVKPNNALDKSHTEI